MPNHYHLLIQTLEGNISRAMRHINGVYTQRFNRRLLAGLSRCAWKVLSLYLTEATPLEDAKAGAVIAVQSFGDFQNFNPHLHVIATDGCFKENKAFKVCPPPRTADFVVIGDRAKALKFFFKGQSIPSVPYRHELAVWFNTR